MDSKWLELTIKPGFTPKVEAYDDFDEEDLRIYLESKVVASEDVIEIDVLDNIFEGGPAN